MTNLPEPDGDADQAPPSVTVVRRPLDLTALLVFATVAALGGGLVAGRVELGLPAFGWSLRPLPIHPYPAKAMVLPLLLGLGLAAAVWAIRRLDRRPRRAACTAVSLLVLGHFALSLTTDWGQGSSAWCGNAVATTWSEVSNGYFTAANNIDDVHAFLASYAATQTSAGNKLSTHPPGAVLAYWLPLSVWRQSPLISAFAEALLHWLVSRDTNDFYLLLVRFPSVPHLPGTLMAGALWCVLSIAFLGSLTVIPVYLLGARFGTRRTGIVAAGLFCLMPSSLFFALSLDVVLMMLTAWGLAAMAAALDSERRALPWGVLAGLWLGLALSVSLGALASVALTLGLGAAMVRCRRGNWHRLAVAAAGLLVGLAAILVGWQAAGVDVLAVVVNGLGAHHHGVAGTAFRPYFPWVVWNLVDYALLVGLPIVVTAMAGVRRREAVAPALAVLAVLLLLSASGIVKAETERLWIFANPLLAASAAVVAAERASWRATLASQPLWLLLTALSLPPLVRPY